jgi:hypothetical protein
VLPNLREWSLLSVVFASILAAALTMASLTHGSLAAPVQHRTYWFSARYLSGPVRHPGDRIKVQWTAHRGSLSTASKPTPLGMTVEILGPYTSVKALKRDFSNYSPASVRGSKSWSTTNWNGRSFVSSLTIPRAAQRGYYDLVVRTSQAGQSMGGASVFEVR